MRRMLVAALLLVVSACASTDPEVIVAPDSTDAVSTTASSNDDGSAVPEPTTTTTESNEALPEGVVESGSPVAPGTTVRVAGFDGDLLDVTLAEVVDPATPGDFGEPEAGSRLIGLRLVIVNAGEEVWSDSPLNSLAVIADDNTQHSGSFLSVQEGPGFADTTAGPGDVRQGWMSVELPESVAIGRVRYTPDSGFADDFAEWTMDLASVTVASEPVVTTPQAGVGDTVTLASFDDVPIAITVGAMEDPAEPGEYSEPQDGNRLAAVELTLENAGSTNYEDSVGNIAAAVTIEGYSFRTTFSETAAGAGFDGSLVLTPGDVRTGWIVFEVPAEFEIAKLTVALDSGFGPEVGEWSLASDG